MKQLDNVLGTLILSEVQSICQRVNYGNDSNKIFNRDLVTITPDNNSKDIFNKLNEYKTPQEVLNEIYIVRYKVGDYIRRHNDVWDTERSFKRTRTLVVQLTDPSTYRGGSTVVYDREGGSFDISKKIDSGMIFDSKLDHEVLTLQAGVRHSLVACYERGGGVSLL